MSLSMRNLGAEWTEDEVNELRKLVDENTPTRVLGLKLGRTEDAIYAKASELGISLKPANQAPFGTA